METRISREVQYALLYIENKLCKHLDAEMTTLMSRTEETIFHQPLINIFCMCETKMLLSEYLHIISTVPVSLFLPVHVSTCQHQA